MKFYSAIHVPLVIFCNNLSDPLTFILALSGQELKLSYTISSSENSK